MQTMRTKRSLGLAPVVGALVLSVAGCNTPQQPAMQAPPAAAQPAAAGASAGAIVVDTSGLLAQSGDPTAKWVQQALPAQLARYVGRRAPGATISAQVNSIVLGPDDSGPAGGAVDTIIGAATVGGRSFSVRATTFYTPSPVDQTLVEQALQGRVQTLSQAFAQSVARKLRH